MTSQPPRFKPDPATKPDMDAILGGRRMRRNRRTDWSRRLVREATLTVDDLIWPMFLTDKAANEPVAAMPGVERLTIDSVVAEARRARDLGIPAIALFPNTDPKLRDDVGSEALNPTEPRLPGAARHQGGGARGRPDHRRGARPLYQPRP